MPEMTSRERILAAYRREPVDRVPISPRVWAWLLATTGSSDTDAFLDLQKRCPIDIQLAGDPFWYVTRVGAGTGPVPPGVRVDVDEWTEGRLKLVRRTFHTPAGTVTDVTRFPPPGDADFGVAPNPSRIEFLVKGRNDFNAVRHLLPPPKDACDFSACRDTEARLGDNGLLLVQILSPVCHRAGHACSMEDLMVWYHTDRAFFDAVFAFFRDQMLEEVKLIMEAGFRYVFANYYYDSLSVGWSPTIWRDVFQPALAELCGMVHGCGGMVNLYDDGKCSGILEMVADAGVDVIQTLTPPPVGDIDLADAKRRIGERVCLMGYVDLLYVLKMGTPELVERTVKEAIETAAPGGGFILGTSDSIREGTPEANVRAYFDAALRYGSGGL